MPDLFRYFGGRSKLSVLPTSDFILPPFKRVSLLLALLLGLLSACSVTRPYERPAVDPAATYRPVDSLGIADTSSLGQYRWDQLFTDPLLQQHLREGLANNLNLLSTTQQIAIAEAYLQQARANYLPSVGLEADAGLTSPSLNAFIGFTLPKRQLFNQFSLGAYLSWEVDLWGRIRSQDRAAAAAYLQSVYGRQAVQAQLVANIASSYYLLLSLDKQREVILSTIENREQSLETIRALKEAGTVTEVAVKQTEAQLYTAQALLVDVENEIKLNENALSILLGRAPDNIARSSLDAIELPLPLSVGVPVQLLSNRPDVLAAESGLINAFELTNAARASFYPTLSITSGGGLNSVNFDNLFSINSLFANLLGNLAQPIFGRRQLRTQLAARRAEQETALLDYRQTILTAYREVADALYNYQANNQKLDIKIRENEALDLAVEYSEELQNQGLANYLEVLRARDSALNTQLNIVQLEYARQNAVVQLYRALGGGWR